MLLIPNIIEEQEQYAVLSKVFLKELVSPKIRVRQKATTSNSCQFNFLASSTSINDLKAHLAATTWKHIGQLLQCRGMIPTTFYAPTILSFSSKGSGFNANRIGL